MVIRLIVGTVMNLLPAYLHYSGIRFVVVVAAVVVAK